MHTYPSSDGDIELASGPAEAESAGGVVTAYATAWVNADLGRMFALYSDSIVVHYGGTSPFAGTHLGKDRLIELLAETATRTQRQLRSIDTVLDSGTEGAIFVTETIRNPPIAIQRALRYRVADGLLVECWLYDHDQHLIDSAWSTVAPTDVR